MARPFAFLLATLLVACGTSAAPVRNTNDCLDPALVKLSNLNVYPSSSQILSSSVTSIQDKTTVQVAQNFAVTYYSTFKVVTNQNKDKVETYVLYQCGTEKPDPVAYGLPNTTKVFSVPLTSISVTDTTPITMLKMLGVQDRISYVSSYAVDPCMQVLASSSCNRSDYNAVADDIDAVFGSSVRAGNPKAVLFTATSDPGTLNRAEYIKYLATFFNKEAIANEQFASVAQSYNKYKNLAASYKSKNNVAAPLMAWIYYQPKYVSKTYNSSEQIDLYFNAYRKQYTEDAGGSMLDMDALIATYVDNSSIVAAGTSIKFYNLSTTLPILRNILKNVDVVVEESYFAKPANQVTLDDIYRQYLWNDTQAATDLKFLRSKALLRTDGVASGMGSAWFDESVARPDTVLRDLVSALLPGALLAANDVAAPRIVRSMFATDRVTLTAPAQCTALTGSSCSLPQQAICPAVYRNCKGELVIATGAQPCAPDCKAPATDGGNGSGLRAAAAPAMLLLALLVALSLVGGPWAL